MEHMVSWSYIFKKPDFSYSTKNLNFLIDGIITQNLMVNDLSLLPSNQY